MKDPARYSEGDIAKMFMGGVLDADSPIAIATIDRRIVFCNRSWKTFFQVDETEDLAGRSSDSLIPDSLAPVLVRAREALETTGKYTCHFQAEWTDQWMQVNASRLEEHDPPIFIVILVDITDTVIAHEKRVRKLFKSVPVPTYIWKKEGDDIVLRDYNDAAETITEGKISELSGTSVDVLYKDIPDINAEIKTCMSDGVTIERETEYTSLYGDWKKWFGLKYVYIPPDTVMVHTEDITDRIESVKKLEKYKDHLEEEVAERTAALEEMNDLLRKEVAEKERTTKALSKSERRYRTVTELTSDYTYSGIVYPDGSMKREWVSGAFTKITGYDPDSIDEVLGRLQIVHGQDKKIAERQRSSYFTDAPQTSEFRIISKDGSIRWILSHGTPRERTEDGGVRVIGAVKDITERKAAEAKLENRNRELRTLNIIGGLFDLAPDNRTALRQTLDLLLQEAEIDTGGIWEFDRDTGGLSCVSARNVPEMLLDPLKTIGPGDRYVKALRDGDVPFIFEEKVGEDDAPRKKLKTTIGLAKVLGLPVKTAGETRVAFILGFPGDRDISDAKLDFFNVVGKQIGLEMERQDLMQEKADQERRLKKLTRRLLSSAEAERANIAHELHDVLGQEIVAITQKMHVIKKGIDVEKKDAVIAFDKAFNELSDLMCRTRTFAYSLAPPVLNDLGLQSAIEEYIEKMIRSEGLEVELIIRGFDDRLPPGMERHLYRVAQEALTNVIRHAEAKYVVVRLIKGYPNVIMDIRDDGKGFRTSDAKTTEGLGITGIRERVQNLDGKFIIRSSPGNGTHLRVEVPLEVDNGK